MLNNIYPMLCHALCNTFVPASTPVSVRHEDTVDRPVTVVAFTEAPSDAVVREGMLKVFACLTSEESQIIWQKNGRQIHDAKDPRIRILANDYLCISPVNVNDSAKYTCVAYNFRTKCVTKHTAKLRVYKDVKEGTIRCVVLKE